MERANISGRRGLSALEKKSSFFSRTASFLRLALSLEYSYNSTKGDDYEI
jgi:hypothetical protein